MFMKLSQHSTAWWVCAAITCVFSASLLTILVYPVYADDRPALCRRDICGAPNGCGPCNGAQDGLGAAGWYEIEARVLGISHWEDDGQCWAEARTYHRTDIKNRAGGMKTVSWRYKALFRQPKFRLICGIDPGHYLVTGSFQVAHQQHRTNTLTQVRTFRLGTPEEQCKYEAQSVTEVIFPGPNDGDVQEPSAQFIGCN